MAVSGAMAITKATLVAGSAAITAQRGSQTWGANYVFSPSGLQNDIGLMSDVFVDVHTNLTPIASGTYTIGTASSPLAPSGIVMVNAAGVPMKLVILANGTVSGVAA